jgi:lipopolysaccharide/colanic/teichoic acid biosynthesis glycosyltransferase
LDGSVKRTLDVVLACVFLVGLSPLCALVAVIVKATSRGPILFRQVRITRFGHTFTLYKFRSMYADAAPYAVTPQSDGDPRITPVGRFLRASSVDELPQLWNVLRGDMSIVGPRPEMPFIVDTYNMRQRRRLNARAGLTGLWQISRARNEPIHQQLQYDLDYLEHATFLLDLTIVARTAALVLRDSVAAARRLAARRAPAQADPALDAPHRRSA